MQGNSGPLSTSREVSEHEMTLSPGASRARLLVELFADAATMKRFVRSFSRMDSIVHGLPADTVSSEVMADAIAMAFEKHGITSAEIVSALVRVRPQRKAEIHAAEREPLDIGGPSTSRLRLAFCGLLGAIAYLLFASLSQVFEGEGDLVARSLKVDESAEPPPLALVTRVEPRSVPFGIDRTSVTIASENIDTTWQVLVASYRSAESVSRELFCALHLKGDPEICKLFQDEEYWLCDEHNNCHDKQPIRKIARSSKLLFVATSSGGGGGGHRWRSYHRRSRMRLRFYDGYTATSWN